MRYLYKRGRGARRRVVHLSGYDPMTGEPLMVPLCGSEAVRFDTTANVPWGQPTCKRCVEKADLLVRS